MSTRGYLFPSNAIEQKRLTILHDLYFPATVDFLKRSCLQQANQVFDVGCGTGLMSLWFAEHSQASITGFDFDDAQLNYAKQQMAKRQYPALVFNQYDLTSSPSLHTQADLTYCRFVLHHLDNPLKGLDNLKQLTKVGGEVIIGEPILDGGWIYPHNQDYFDIVELIAQHFAACQRDPNYGKRLISDVKAVGGLDIVDTVHFRPVLTQTEHKYHNGYVLSSFRSNLLKLNLISKKRLTLLEDRAKKIAEDDGYITDLFGLMFVRLKRTQ